MAIQIQISDEVWAYLNQNKAPGETFEEVLRRLLKLNKGGNEDETEI